jgi:hypothetical protein
LPPAQDFEAFILFFFRSEVRHGRDPVRGPRFSFPGNCYGAPKAGQFGHHQDS